MKKHLEYKDTTYIFKLTLSVNDFYKTKIGKPPEGIAYITINYGSPPHTSSPQNIEEELSIE